LRSERLLAGGLAGSVGLLVPGVLRNRGGGVMSLRFSLRNRLGLWLRMGLNLRLRSKLGLWLNLTLNLRHIVHILSLRP